MRLSMWVLLAAAGLLLIADPAFAEEAAASGGAITDRGLAIIGIAIAAVGGAWSQGKAISAALESIARNPAAANQMTLPWLLCLVLIESLVIYAFVVALRLVGMI